MGKYTPLQPKVASSKVVDQSWTEHAYDVLKLCITCSQGLHEISSIDYLLNLQGCLQILWVRHPMADDGALKCHDGLAFFKGLLHLWSHHDALQDISQGLAVSCAE